MLSPKPIDMTTVQAFRAWNSTTIATTDDIIQETITGLSLEFLKLTGRGNANWQTNSANPFTQPVDYIEVYDGNGNSRLFLRNFPINSLTSCGLANYTYPLSTGFGSAGVAIDSMRNAITFQGGSVANRSGFTPTAYGLWGGGRGAVWPQGNQNIQVSYNAGFFRQIITDEQQTIPAASVPANGSTPAVIALTVVPGTIDNGWQWLANTGVKFFSDGTALTRVFVFPGAGEYFIQQDNSYLFNVADAGKVILLSYEAQGTPADIVLAMNKWVALNYARRSPNRVGVRSVAMKDVGQTTYTTWAMDPDVQQVIDNYSRNTF